MESKEVIYLLSKTRKDFKRNSLINYHPRLKGLNNNSVLGKLVKIKQTCTRILRENKPLLPLKNSMKGSKVRKNKFSINKPTLSSKTMNHQWNKKV